MGSSLALPLLGNGGVIWLHKQRGSFLNWLLVGEDGDVKACMLQSAHGQARIFLVLTFLHQPEGAKNACFFAEITFPRLDQIAHVIELFRLDNARAFGGISQKHQLQTSQRQKLELTLVEFGTSKEFMLIADQHRKFTKPLLPSLQKTCSKTMYQKNCQQCFKSKPMLQPGHSLYLLYNSNWAWAMASSCSKSLDLDGSSSSWTSSAMSAGLDFSIPSNASNQPA